MSRVTATRTSRHGRAACTGRAVVVPMIQRKPVAHEPSVRVNAEGKFRPACVCNCLDDYASNLPWQDDEDGMLDYAAALLEEAENGPSDDDPRHSDVTRGWAVSA